MQRCKRFVWLTGFLLLTSGCALSGGKESAGDSGPSPNFGLRAPSQSEPPVEDSGKGQSVASRSDQSSSGGDENNIAPPNSGSRKRRLAGAEREPAQARPLPVSDSTDSLADDASPEL